MSNSKRKQKGKGKGRKKEKGGERKSENGVPSCWLVPALKGERQQTGRPVERRAGGVSHMYT